MGQNFRYSQQITTAANAMAAALAAGLTTEQENVLGNLLTVVGTSLTAHA